jgi:hypothetical protein
MFAGTPYAHLHVCGSSWDGNEYHPGDRGVWTMTYAPRLHPPKPRNGHVIQANVKDQLDV